MSEKQVWDQLDDTVGDVGALNLVVIHLLVEIAGGTKKPDEWLRTFADKVYQSVDRAPLLSPLMEGKVEALRSKIDHLLLSAQRRIAGD